MRVGYVCLSVLHNIVDVPRTGLSKAFVEAKTSVLMRHVENAVWCNLPQLAATCNGLPQSASVRPQVGVATA